MIESTASKFKTEKVNGVLAAIGEHCAEGSLDALVHDCASEQASAVNNSGKPAQAEYLLTSGWTAEDILGRLRIQREDEG
jgi:hypothetical protein